MILLLARDDRDLLQEVVYAADGVTREPFGKPGGPGLWHRKGAQLPAYVQEVAHDLVDGGMTESHAIATAVSRCKVWCATSKDPAVKAKACAAVAEWEALKVKAAAFDEKLHPRDDQGRFSFSVGEHVRVHSGYHKGLEGYVVKDTGTGVHIRKEGEGPLSPPIPLKKEFVEPTGKPSKPDLPMPSSAEPTLTEETAKAGMRVKIPGMRGKTAEIVRVRRGPHGIPGADVQLPRDPSELGGGYGVAHWIPLTQLHPAKKVKAAWNPALHPRAPKGSPAGGQFAPGSTAPAPTNQNPVGTGAGGQRVTDLQKRLTQLGFPLAPDGQFGPKTLAAVRAFQQSRGLKVDGLVGPKTTAALRQVRTRGPGARPGQSPGGRGVLLSAPEQPALATLPAVEILAAGTWKLSSGRQTFTRADITAAIEASKCPAVGPPLIKIGHLDQRFKPKPGEDGEPALGRVLNMRADKSGMKLLGDLAGMPGWLAGISASAFPRRSVEGSYNFTCQTGHEHPFVISALALLGITRPGVGVLGELRDIARLYGVNAAAERPWQVTYEESEAIVPVTEEDVRRAYYAAGEVPQTWWISELQMDPSQLIVTDGDGQVYRVPFDIRGSAVEFGEPDPIESYGALAASRGSGPVMVFASEEESRFVADVDAARNAGDAEDRAEGPETGPPDAEDTAEGHEAMTGTHTHSHPAYGSQGGDATHTHQHTHQGDAAHQHAHGTQAGAGNNGNGGADVDFTDEQNASLRASLGLGDNDELTAAVIVEGIRKTKVAASRAPLPTGVMTIEKEAWDNLQKQVKRHEEFRASVARNERDQVVAEAVRAGKFSAARAEHWKRLWDADPDGTREVMGSLQKNVVPVDDIGTPGGQYDDALIEEEYKSLFPPGMQSKG